MTNPREELRRIWIAKIVLGITLVGTVLIGDGRRAWPVMTWPMYQRRIFEMPGPQFERIGLRAELEVGHSDLSIRGHFPPGRDDVVTSVVEQVLRSDGAERSHGERYLLSLARRALPEEEVRAVEIHELRWDLELRKDPPFDRAAPKRRVLHRILPEGR